MNKPEMAANFHATRRHWSVNLTLRLQAFPPGRVGAPLCGRPIDVYDQQAIGAIYQYARKYRVIADLPPCQRCDKLMGGGR